MMTVVLVKMQENIDRFRKITIIHVIKSMRGGKRKRSKDPEIDRKDSARCFGPFSAKRRQVESLLLLLDRDREKDMGS